MALSGCTSPAAEVDAAATTPETTAPQALATETAPSDPAAPAPSSAAAGASTTEPSDTPSEEPSEEPTDEPAETEEPALDTAPSMAPVSPPPALEVCTAAQLTGSVQDQLGGGAAGSVYRTLVLTNASDRTCTVQGYPGVSFVDAAGAQLGAAADRDGSADVPVTVDPGASVSATLQQTNAQNYGEDCELVPAAGLRVYPPGATDSLILPQQIPACSADSIVLLHVGTLQPMH